LTAQANYWAAQPTPTLAPESIPPQPQKVISQADPAPTEPDKPLSQSGPWLIYEDSYDNELVDTLNAANMDGSGQLLIRTNFWRTGSIWGPYLTFWDAVDRKTGFGVFNLQQQRSILEIELADNPVWSPDGRFLAYAAYNEGPTLDVYTFNPVTAAERRLTDGSQQAAVMGWSPDSKWIIHSSWIFSEKRHPMTDLPLHQLQALWAVHAVSGEVRKLCDVIWESEQENILTWTAPDEFIFTNNVDLATFNAHSTHLQRANLTTQTCKPIFTGVFEDEAVDPQSGTIFLTGGAFVPFDTAPEIGIKRLLPGESSAVLVQSGMWHEVDWLQAANVFVASWGWPGDERTAYFQPDGSPDLRFAAESRFVPLPSPDGHWLAFTGTNKFDADGIRLYNLDGDWVRHILPGMDTRQGKLIWAADNSGFWFAQEVPQGGVCCITTFEKLIWYSLKEDRSVLLVKRLVDIGVDEFVTIIWP